MPHDDYPEETENLRPPRHAPLIERRSEPDYFSRTLLGAIVALLGFICWSAWTFNREMGELRGEFRTYTQATDRRITALEDATDRRLTALEQRVWKNE